VTGAAPAASADTVARIRATGIIPILRTPSAQEAIAAAEAICAGGIDVVEVTMGVPGAIEVIAELSRRLGPEVVLGAGTVLDPATARACRDAGARFVLAPGFDPETVAWCRREDLPILPGALTPTEVVQAWRAGAAMVKVFPCHVVGGASYVRALKAPLPQIELLPTGGVSLATVADFFRAGASAVGAGSDLVDLARLRAGDAAAITAKAQAYVEAIARARAG
jgi:2-dehydro-3-deoxyphosphogluconate aldolase/(4S)-4-hydroxy-2-oxoglutarate aldolase